MNPLPFLFAHWKALGIAALVIGAGIYIAILKGSLAEANGRAVKWQEEAIQRGAMLETQSAAVAELHRISKQKQKAAAVAVKRAGPGIQRVIERIVSEPVVKTADCRTPELVKEAERLLSVGGV